MLVFRSLCILAFVVSLLPFPNSYGDQTLVLPEPGVMVHMTPAFAPVLLKGIKVHPEDPFKFDFILDQGNSKSAVGQAQIAPLIKYFLAALTVPEKDLWVNLSPYEQNRMISRNLGQTVMGRDMLAQDYLLKQLTASLIYPENGVGKKFWANVYSKIRQTHGSGNVPVNAFNKVWIVADKADVFEHNQTAYITGAHLKVMLDQDYLAAHKNERAALPSGGKGNAQIMRQIILPELEKEINRGRNFAPLRQMFYSIVLASWYKMALKDALLSQVYANQSKVTVGVNQADAHTNAEIFNRYLEAYKKGVFNYIKDEAIDGQAMPRKYFSGGLDIFNGKDPAQLIKVSHAIDKAMLLDATAPIVAQVVLTPQSGFISAEKFTSLEQITDDLVGREDFFEAIPAKLLIRIQKKITRLKTMKRAFVKLARELYEHKVNGKLITHIRNKGLSLSDANIIKLARLFYQTNAHVAGGWLSMKYDASNKRFSIEIYNLRKHETEANFSVSGEIQTAGDAFNALINQIAADGGLNEYLIRTAARMQREIAVYDANQHQNFFARGFKEGDRVELKFRIGKGPISFTTGTIVGFFPNQKKVIVAAISHPDLTVEYFTQDSLFAQADDRILIEMKVIPRNQAMISKPAVLIIDDDAGEREKVAGPLKAAGFEVVEAGTFADARQYLSRQNLIAIISDFNIEGEGTLESFLSNLRNLGDIAAGRYLIVRTKGVEAQGSRSGRVAEHSWSEQEVELLKNLWGNPRAVSIFGKSESEFNKAMRKLSEVLPDRAQKSEVDLHSITVPGAHIAEQYGAEFDIAKSIELNAGKDKSYILEIRKYKKSTGGTPSLIAVLYRKGQVSSQRGVLVAAGRTDVIRFEGWFEASFENVRRALLAFLKDPKEDGERFLGHLLSGYKTAQESVFHYFSDIHKTAGTREVGVTELLRFETDGQQYKLEFKTYQRQRRDTLAVVLSRHEDGSWRPLTEGKVSDLQKEKNETIEGNQHERAHLADRLAAHISNYPNQSPQELNDYIVGLVKAYSGPPIQDKLAAIELILESMRVSAGHDAIRIDLFDSNNDELSRDIFGAMEYYYFKLANELVLSHALVNNRRILKIDEYDPNIASQVEKYLKYWLLTERNGLRDLLMSPPRLQRTHVQRLGRLFRVQGGEIVMPTFSNAEDFYFAKQIKMLGPQLIADLEAMKSKLRRREGVSSPFRWPQWRSLARAYYRTEDLDQELLYRLAFLSSLKMGMHYSMSARKAEIAGIFDPKNQPYYAVISNLEIRIDETIAYIKSLVPDLAMSHATPAANGGIDLRGGPVLLHQKGVGFEMKSNKNLIEQFKVRDFEGFNFQIKQITPIADLRVFLGG